MAAAISKSEFALNAGEIVDQVRQGQTIVVQSGGHEQIVILDAFDYRLLRAVVAYALKQDEGEANHDLHDVVRLYLDEHISLSKAAELLGVSRFDIMERFARLGMPLRSGSTTVAEAQAEVEAARHAKT